MINNKLDFGEKTRKDEMREQVTAFHEQHPEVWDLFVRFSFDVIKRGFSNYSVNAIFERIRWEKDMGVALGGHCHDGRRYQYYLFDLKY